MLRNILFPCEPFSPRSPEPHFQGEFEAAKAAGFEVGLYDDEEHRLLTRGLEGTTLYRGWMMSTKAYSGFASQLESNGLNLLTSPQEYELCHHLPGWYHLLEGETPLSTWCPAQATPQEWPLAEFGQGPLIVKDYVKSEKHYWHEACYIPEPGQAAPVVERFKELRGNVLEGGLVFRQFLHLKSLGPHQQSGMPLTLEYRLFFWKGQLLAAKPYWEQVGYPQCQPPQQHFTQLAARILSPFFTMDVACDEEDKWWVIELGDGQVAGLPPELSAEDFYHQLRQGDLANFT